MKSLAPIQLRIDALASQALEQVVTEAETRDDVKVTDVEVHVAADAPCGQPALDVRVTVQRAARNVFEHASDSH